jgi:hypothetical protein
MANNNSIPAIPGLNNPQTYGMPAGNPRDSSISTMNSSNQSTALAANLLSGGRLRRKLKGGSDIQAGQIKVGTFQMPYNSTGPSGPNSQIQSNAQTSTQMAANSALDLGATQMNGGFRRRRKGGNTDWVWGCMSGGIRRKLCRSYRRRTSRKSKRLCSRQRQLLTRSKKTRKY